MKILTTLLLLFSVVTNCLPQRDVIHFENPSFEDNPHDSYVPKGWYDCGFEQSSPPDVQPNNRHFLQMTAHNGETFLGMVTRDNKTWERIGQSLRQPIVAGKCYAVAIALAKSPIYLSYSSLTT